MVAVTAAVAVAVAVAGDFTDDADDVMYNDHRREKSS